MEKSIVNAIKSCLNQTYKNIEILIVNDGSTDNSISVINENISDSRIHIYNRKKNEGVSFAMYDLVEQAKGTYICFLDADDTMMPMRVEKQYNAIKYAEKRYPSRMVASFCGSMVNDINKKTQYFINPYDLWNLASDHTFGGGVGHSMYKVEDLKKLGNFDTHFIRSTDSAMCLYFLINNGFYAMLPEPLINYNFYWNKNKDNIAKLDEKYFNELRNEIKIENPHNLYLQRFIGTNFYEKREIRRTKISLFGIIPIVKIKYKQNGNKILVYLFGFIPFILIKNKRK